MRYPITAALMAASATLVAQTLAAAPQSASIMATAAPAAQARYLGPLDVPAEYAIVHRNAPGTVRVGRDGEMLIRFEPGGGGRLIENHPNANPALHWSVLADGRIELVPVAPRLRQFTVNGEGACTQAVFDGSEYADRWWIERISSAPGVDVLQVQMQLRTTYIDRIPNDACAAPPASTQIWSRPQLGFHPGSGELPFTSGESLGSIMLTYRRFPELASLGPEQWSAAMFVPRSNSAYAEGLQSAIGSRIGSDGRLRIDARTVDGGPVALEYRRLQRDGYGGEGIFAVSTLPDGREVADYTLSARAVKYSFPRTLQGTWESGFARSQAFEPLPTQPMTIEFTQLPVTAGSEGLGVRRLYSIDPQTGQTVFMDVPFSFTTTLSGLTMNTYRVNGQSVAQCAGRPQCVLLQRRQWQVLSKFESMVDTRLYVLESLFSMRDGVLEPISVRANFYDRFTSM